MKRDHVIFGPNIVAEKTITFGIENAADDGSSKLDTKNYDIMVTDARDHL